MARRRKTRIFVQVKARASFDEAAESITDRQRARIAACAEAWLAACPQPHVLDMRFDTMLVTPGKNPRHIPAAFES